MRRLAALLPILALTAGCHTDAVNNPDGSPATPGYEAIDLGTLGGYSATPVALNDRGQIVGYSDRSPAGNESQGDPHAFLWDNGTMYDLELVPGGDPSAAEAINGLGQVAGRRNPRDQAGSRAFVWDRLGRGGELDAGTGAVPWNVIGINDQGDVVASVTSPSYGFRAVMWRGGVLEELPGLNAAAERTPRSMNADGLVVGSSFVFERGSPYDFFHPVLWENGHVRDLGVLSHAACPTPGPTECGYGSATAMNSDGVVVGWSNTASVTRAFRWQNGVLSELEGLSDRPMWAWVVNDRGQIAGDWGLAPVGGFFWDGGVAVDIGSLGGGATRVRAIGQGGEVVGSSVTQAGGQHAILWRDGQMIDLGLGPSPVGAQASVAIAINSRGDVLGVSGNCARRFDGSCNLEWPMRGILWRRIQP